MVKVNGKVLGWLVADVCASFHWLRHGQNIAEWIGTQREFDIGPSMYNLLVEDDEKELYERDEREIQNL